MRKRIGIFGGSFNPSHNGHVEICRYLLDNNDVDEIIVIPCFVHPFEKNLVPFDDRLTMCKFAFGEFLGKVTVSDAEKRIGKISHTIKTIQYLQNNFPNDRFFFIMGSDTMSEFDTWKDAEKIRSLVHIITLPRGSRSPITNISSTDVRNSIKNGKKFAGLVPSAVAVYIITHGLYS